MSAFGYAGYWAFWWENRSEELIALKKQEILRNRQAKLEAAERLAASSLEAEAWYVLPSIALYIKSDFLNRNDLQTYLELISPGAIYHLLESRRGTASPESYPLQLSRGLEASASLCIHSTC